MKHSIQTLPFADVEPDVQIDEVTRLTSGCERRVWPVSGSLKRPPALCSPPTLRPRQAGEQADESTQRSGCVRNGRTRTRSISVDGCIQTDPEVER